MMQKRLVTLASVVIVGIMVSMAWQQAAKSSDNNEDVKKSEKPPPKEDQGKPREAKIDSATRAR